MSTSPEHDIITNTGAKSKILEMNITSGVNTMCTGLRHIIICAIAHFQTKHYVE